MPTLDITPSGQACGATVRGVDLRSVDDDAAAAIRSAWLNHKVLAFPDQDLTDDDLESFTLRFGPFGADPLRQQVGPVFRAEQVAHVSVVGV